MIASAPVLRAASAPSEVHAVVRAILSEKRFRTPLPSPHRTLFEIVWDWITGLWNRLMDALSAHVHIGGKTAVVIGDGIALLLILIVVLVAARLFMRMVRDPVASSVVRRLAPERDADELYEASLRAARAGQYRDAIALLFLAALSRLEQLGIAREDRSRTVNEWRRAVSARPAIASAFDAIARAFTAAFYAERNVSQSEWAAADAAFVALPQAQR